MFFMSRKLDLQMDFKMAVELRALQSVGMAFLFVPIQTISYAGVPPQKNNQVSGIMNLSRNMGGDIGIAFVTALVARRAQVHQAALSAHTTAFDPAYQSKLDALTAALQHAGATSIVAARQATGVMYRQLLAQSTQLAYLDALSALAVATALMVPLVWLSRRPQGARAPAGH
jgi:DHA2 family multidrug resistance protein